MSAAVPVVLLHGVGLDRSMWGPLAAMIDRDVVTLDLPGHGGRPALREQQTLASMADDVRQRLPDGPVHLVGFSLGALIAQHLARFAAERVRTLTCVSSVCRRTVTERAAVESRLRAAADDFAGSAQTALDRWYPAGTTVSPEQIARTREVLLGNDVESYLHAYRVFAHGDAEIGPELGAIDVPSLAVTGQLDPGSTPEMSRRLGRAIPHCRVDIIPNARHMLPVEDTGALCTSITTFLNHTEGPARD